MMWMVGVVVLVIVVGVVYLLARNNTPATTNPPANPPAGSATSKTINLTAQNNSGQSGTMLLEEVGSQVRVTLTLANPNTTSEPAHIHVGACPNPGAVKYPLTNVLNGTSVTMINGSLASLKSEQPLAVNVHKSAAESSVYVSCGDLNL